MRNFWLETGKSAFCLVSLWVVAFLHLHSVWHSFLSSLCVRAQSIFLVAAGIDGVSKQRDYFLALANFACFTCVFLYYVLLP